MGALISFFVILVISYVAVRIGATFLKLTGMSEEAAAFQARSAFSGTGYTTKESELVMGHPVRRKIIMVMMLVRNAGLVSVLSTLILSFVKTTTSGEVILRIAVLFSGLVFLLLLSRSRLLNRILGKIIEGILRKISSVDINDYESLLNISGDYAIAEQLVEGRDWMAEKSLASLELPKEGLLVLSVRRSDGYFIGAPHGETFLHGGDRVIMYGREGAIRALGERPYGDAGEQAHRGAVEEHNRLSGREGRRHQAAAAAKRRGFFQKLAGKVNPE